jgi:hypothetical protein
MVKYVTDQLKSRVRLFPIVNYLFEDVNKDDTKETMLKTLWVNIINDLKKMNQEKEKDIKEINFYEGDQTISFKFEDF